MSAWTVADLVPGVVSRHDRYITPEQKMRVCEYLFVDVGHEACIHRPLRAICEQQFEDAKQHGLRTLFGEAAITCTQWEARVRAARVLGEHQWQLCAEFQPPHYWNTAYDAIAQKALYYVLWGVECMPAPEGLARPLADALPAVVVETIIGKPGPIDTDPWKTALDEAEKTHAALVPDAWRTSTGEWRQYDGFEKCQSNVCRNESNCL